MITGATGGIGTAVAHGLSDHGFAVCVAARNRTAGEELVKSIQARGGHAEYVYLDLEQTKPAQLRRTFARKPIALLVNNAGTMGRQVGGTMRVNLCAPAILTLSLLPCLKACEGGGRIVNVGSSSHLRAGKVDHLVSDLSIDKTLTAYAQSKLGLMHLSLLLRVACNQSGIIIHDCHPGIVWTPMLRRHFGEIICSILTRSGLSGWLFRTPDQGAAAVLWACLAPASPPTVNHEELLSQYFVNGERDRGRAASPESRSCRSALRTWHWLLNAEPDVSRLAEEAGVAQDLFASDFCDALDAP